MVNVTGYFDLKEVIVNELVGSTTLFVILGILLIMYLAARFKIQWQATSILAILFLIGVFANFGLVMLWVFILLFVGVFIVFASTRIFKR